MTELRRSPERKAKRSVSPGKEGTDNPSTSRASPLKEINETTESTTTNGVPPRRPYSINIDRSTVFKLIFFTILMFTLPFITYYYAMNMFFEGNELFSAISAAVMANLVLAGYIVTAFLEDYDDNLAKKKE